MSQPSSTNVAALLARRETGCAHPGVCARGLEHGSVTRKLEQWQEADFMQNSSADYASFQPAPRSTIALCYNCDGSMLASTHGDHTVKVTSCHTGRLSRVLTGHRRTPWVVRFHPRLPHMLASGSLDHEVRLWDAHTGQCFARHTFGKPIASLAFHVSAGVLAIACGHKLYMWQYGEPGSPPVIVLKTRRSMRAVHFHPHGLPMVLTAEVQDPSPTAELSQALTERGPYCPGAQPPPAQGDSSGSGAAASDSQRDGQLEGGDRVAHAPMNAAQLVAQALQEAAAGRQAHLEAAIALTREAALRQEEQAQTRQHSHAVGSELFAAANIANPLGALSISQQPQQPGAGGAEPPMQAAASGSGHGEGPWARNPHQLPPSMVPVGWEVPFPTGFPYQMRPPGPTGPATDPILWMNPRLVAAINASVWNIIGDEAPPRVRLRLWRFDAAKPARELDERTGLRLQLSDAVLCSEMGVHFSPCGRFLAATVGCRGPGPPPTAEAAVVAAAVGQAGVAGQAAMDWSPERSPGGPSGWQRTLSLLTGGGGAATMVLPHDSAPTAEAAHTALDAAAAASALPPPPPRPERVVFEVRVFSIDGAHFGEVVRAKCIRAAHCLTSVQFSPACDHVLLAYGKKHNSLLRSLVADRGALLPMHTILEVYRLADMALVRVLPSAEDEINAACFHPAPGGGIAYGTKEGRLRVVGHDRGGQQELGAAAAAAGAPPRAPDMQGQQQDIALMEQQQWVEHRTPGA